MGLQNALRSADSVFEQSARPEAGAEPVGGGAALVLETQADKSQETVLCLGGLETRTP